MPNFFRLIFNICAYRLIMLHLIHNIQDKLQLNHLTVFTTRICVFLIKIFLGGHIALQTRKLKS